MNVAPLERVGIAFGVGLWLVSVVLHLDLAVQGRLAWAPIYVAAGEAPGDFPRLDGFWPETAERADLPRIGDRVLQVGDRSAAGLSRLGFLAAFYAAAGADLEVPVRVEREGDLRDARIALIPYATPWIYTPLILGLGISAAIIYMRRREVPAARAAAFASLAYSLHWAAFLSGGGWRTTLGLLVHVGALAIATPLALRAVQLFGVRDARAASARWPWLFLGLGILHASWQIGAPISADWALPLLLAAYVVYVLCLLVTLARTYHAGEIVVRRQLRWVLLGFYLGLAPIVAGAALAAWQPAWRPAYEWSLLALVMIPIGLTLALTRYNLFDVDRLISATASYSIVLVGLLALGVRALPAVATAAGDATDLSPQVVQSGLALLIAVVLFSSGNAIRPALERVFFRERFALDAGVRELRDAVRRLDAPAPMFDTLGTRLVELLRLEDCVIYVRTQDVFVPLFVRGAAVPPAFDAEGRLAPLLEEAGEPVEATRWHRWGENGLLGEFERAQLDGLDARLLVSISGEKRLAGFACLGEKGSGDVYTPADRALLEGLFDRVGMQLERFDAKAIREAERERSARLAGYVPSAVRAELSRSVPEVAPGEREVSVLFVDIRGYMTLSTGLRSDDIFRVVNAYTTTASRVIQQHGGWVVEFQGDGLMAVFGAPREHAHKERSAVTAALDVVRAVEGGIDEISEIPLEVGVGVATGPAYVGDVQSIDRKIWCVIGNTTNLAARLQGMTRHVDASIVIDDLTRRRGGNAADVFRRLENVRVKGRSDALTVHLA